MFGTIFKSLIARMRRGILKRKSYTNGEAKRLIQLVEDLVNPVKVDWQLSESDHKVIESYVNLFIRDNCIKVDRMVVSTDLYPELGRFIHALKGHGPWQKTMAAYDYLEEHWPELGPLLAEDR
jgi:hypothetical protein